MTIAVVRKLNNNITMEGSASSINSRATAIKAILLAAWRGKLTNEEWETRIRKVLPRGVNGDVYDLADCLLKQALIGPVPNQLFISYLKHAVQSELVSHSAVLKSISSQPINLRASALIYRTSPIVCLLDFLQSFRDNIACHGTEVECLNLCHSLSGLIHWLLKCIYNTLEYILCSQLQPSTQQQLQQHNMTGNLTNSSSSSSSAASSSAGGNQQNTSSINANIISSSNTLGNSNQLDTSVGIIDLCTETIHYFITRPFTKSLLFINKIEYPKEFKENILKTVQLIQQQLVSCQHLQYIEERVQHLSILHQLILTFNSKELHPSMVAAQQLRYLQTHRIRSTEITSGSKFEKRIQQYNSSNPSHNSIANYALFNSIYPLVAFDAILRPARLNKHLARQIVIITNFNSAPINMTYCELIRVCLIGLIDAHGNAKAKASWSFFTFLKLPRLLIELNKTVIRASGQLVNPTDPNLANNFINDLKQAFERLCEYSPLLDEAEYKCNCDLFKCLIKELMKNDASLVQLKNLDCRDFSAMRQNILNNNNNPLGGHMMLRTEPVVTSMLETLNSEQDPAELFGILAQSCSGLSFEYTLSAAAATGRLHLFVKRLIEHNELHKTPPENSTNLKHVQAQALNFDISFLILIYIAQRYGPELIEKDHTGKLTFNRWYHERYNQDTCFSCPSEMLKGCDDKIVASLINQLLSKSSDVKMHHVNWHDICFNIPKAMSEIINAWTQGCLNDDDITVVIERLRSRMCFMAVVASTWLQCYIRTLNEEDKPKLVHFLNCLTKTSSHSRQQQHESSTELKTDGLKERSSLLGAIVKRIYFELVPAMSPGSPNLPSKNNRLATQLASHNATSNVPNNGNNQSNYDESREGAAYHSYKDRFISTLTTKEIFMANVKQCLSRGWIGYDSLNSLSSLFKIIGSERFTSLLVNQILMAHESPSDLSRAVNITFGLFHLDIEACAFALLQEVIPSWLTGEKKQTFLNQPRAFALANLAVMTIIEVYNNLQNTTVSEFGQTNATNSTSLLNNNSQPEPDKRFSMNGVVKQEPGAIMQARNSMVIDGADSRNIKRQKLSHEFASNNDIGASQMSPDAVERLNKLNLLLADLMRLFKGIMSDPVMSHRTLFPVLFLQQTVVCAREGSSIVTVHLQPDILLDIIDLFSSELTFELVLSISNLSSTNSRKYSAKAMCKLAEVKESTPKSPTPDIEPPPEEPAASNQSSSGEDSAADNSKVPAAPSGKAIDGPTPMVTG